MTTQTCPNCHTVNDTGVYVTGQRLKCRGCGISIEVRHEVVTRIGNRSLAQASGGHAFGPAEDSQKPTDPPRAADSGAAAPVEVSSPPPVVDNVVQLRRDGNTLPGPVLDQTLISKSGLRIEVPGYELVQLLGQGGMGEVWRAQQQSLGRAVAVKVLPPQLATDPEFVARFAKESTALAALNHPNVIQIIDRGISGGHYYFVMELVAGRSLREVMNAGRLPPGEALKLILQVVRAIDYAHEQGIIHRDLKPENILVDERGNVKVADFGLAGIQREQERQHQLTATAVAMGTVNYMAPEQRRDAKHVDGRADLYSVGVVFYEMLTAELPLGRFRLPSEKIDGIDPRFDIVISQLLEPEPEQRTQSAALLCEELEPLLADFTSATGRTAGHTTARGRPGNVSKQATAVRGQGAQHSSVVASSWKGLRYGLTVIGALALVGVAVRMFGGTWQVDRNGFKAQVSSAKIEVPLHLKHGHSDKGKLPPNTDGELKTTSKLVIANNGVTHLGLDFKPNGEEVIHAHAGSWTVVDGKLVATQAGNETTGSGPLIPRAYVDDRFFDSDDLDLSVGLTVAPLEADDFPELVNPQRFAELAYRFRDLQISAFADADSGMRLAWKYTRAGGEEEGTSGRDVRVGLEDVVPVPSNRAFVVRLLLQKRDNGIQARAYVDDQQFASHFLPGLRGGVGKIALGCRNLHCSFDDLSVSGKLVSRPAGPGHEEH